MGEPARIVSLVPSHTESLHALGLAARVVGRTRFCIHPEPWVGTVPAVGGTKDARLDRILALRPDLVVADKDENPKALVEALQAAGVEVLWSEIDAVEDAARFLEALGRRCGADQAATVLARDLRAAMAEVAVAGGGGPGVPVFCPIWHAPWMTFDRTAYPSAMLAAVGLRNVFADHAGPKYFQVADGEVAAAGAQWSLLPSEPFPFHRHPVDTSGLGPAGHPERVRVIDGEALTWFGARTAAGLRELAGVARSLVSPGGGAAAGPRSPAG
ncbi:MAG TPA: helical backbone metal receptor [Candidatus Thermoplasmatota archaeon]|nr:helical backbone metal receptor [Candidatus Thermoplasmatota archaeon]